MSFRTVLLLTVTLIQGVVTESDICYEKIGCLSMSFPWSSILRSVPAPLPPDELPIKLYFYSRESRQGIHILTPFPEVNLHRAPLKSSRPTVIITHDFEDNQEHYDNHPWMYHLKDAYLQNVDANVIVMDWSSGSIEFETAQAVGNARVVGKVMARFLRQVSESTGLLPKDVHLIGDGLGAHLMSYVANDFHGTGRITGLDPTMKYFELQDHRVRLDQSDAEFVDVIHTSAKILGLFGGGWGAFLPAGHVDFYPNGGDKQPGCLSLLHIPRINSLGEIPDLAKKFREWEEMCNHRRAREYYIEAVKVTGNCIFWGHKVNPVEFIRNNFNQFTGGFLAIATTELCTDFECTPMGIDTPKYPGRGVFMLTTRRSAPYCIRHPSISFIKFITPLKEMINSFRVEVPILQQWLPEFKDEGPVP